MLYNNPYFCYPLPESIRFASVVALRATFDSVVIAPGKVNTRFARASFSSRRNLFVLRFAVTLYGDYYSSVDFEENCLQSIISIKGRKKLLHKKNTNSIDFFTFVSGKLLSIVLGN